MTAHPKTRFRPLLFLLTALLLLGLLAWAAALYIPHALRLRREAAWRASLESTRQAIPPLPPIDIGNGLELELVPIPAGTFDMGSPPTEKHRWYDETLHPVTLTHSFYIGKYEVTQAQWEQVHGGTPSHFTGAELPVEQISWDNCLRFCKALNDTGLAPAGWHFSLPTEAQWEYACRAGATAPYAGNGCLASMGWYAQNSGWHTHPVGQKLPNAWGLYDMHGNVFEWCLDGYDGYPATAESDPEGPSTRVTPYRIVRGGGWGADARACRSAHRENVYHNSSLNAYIGMRVALVPDTPEP